MKTKKEQILELRDKGHSYKEIQNIVGCSKGTIAYHLGIGQKDKSKQRVRECRTKVLRFLQEYKSQKICCDCKENYPYWMLEFDHLGDKKFTISEFRNSTMSIDKIKEEIDKCEVVCCNCHRNRTFQRQVKDGKYVGLEFCNYPE